MGLVSGAPAAPRPSPATAAAAAARRRAAPSEAEDDDDVEDDADEDDDVSGGDELRTTLPRGSRLLDPRQARSELGRPYMGGPVRGAPYSTDVACMRPSAWPPWCKPAMPSWCMWPDGHGRPKAQRSMAAHLCVHAWMRVMWCGVVWCRPAGTPGWSRSWWPA